MYAVEPGVFGPLEINAVLVGTARATLDEYERILRTKKAPGGIAGPSGNVIDATPSETHDFQRWFGLATARVQAAEKLLLGVAEELTEACVEATTDGRGWKWEEVGRFNLVRHQSIELGWQAVDLMFRTSGTSQVVADSFRYVFDAEDAEDAEDADAVERYFAVDYRQHMPGVPSGRAALEHFVRTGFPDGPKPVPDEPITPPIIVMAENDLVIYTVPRPQPDPEHPGETYPYLVFNKAAPLRMPP